MDNKIFWKKVKPLFSEKVNVQTKNTLVEKRDVFYVTLKSLRK